MAKTMAKVHPSLSGFSSSSYRGKGSEKPVLVDSFGAKNVTCVPSICAGKTVSNGTGIAIMPFRAGAASNVSEVSVLFE